MKVIILCGGYGARLKEETEFMPKPLVKVGGHPLLWHIIQIYRHHGYRDFILALGYKGEMIAEAVRKGLYFEGYTVNRIKDKTVLLVSTKDKADILSITLVETGLHTLPGERVAHCGRLIPETDDIFMLTYGDGVANININDVVSFHKRKKLKGTICGVHPRSKFGLLSVDDSHRVTALIEKPVLFDWVNGGFMVFDRQVLPFFRAGEMEHVALQRLIDAQQLAMYPHNDFWFAVDTYKELEDLNTIWKSGHAPWKLW